MKQITIFLQNHYTASNLICLNIFGEEPLRNFFTLFFGLKGQANLEKLKNHKKENKDYQFYQGQWQNQVGRYQDPGVKIALKFKVNKNSIEN